MKKRINLNIINFIKRLDYEITEVTDNHYKILIISNIKIE